MRNPPDTRARPQSGARARFWSSVPAKIGMDCVRSGKYPKHQNRKKHPDERLESEANPSICECSTTKMIGGQHMMRRGGPTLLSEGNQYLRRYIDRKRNVQMNRTKGQPRNSGDTVYSVTMELGKIPENRTFRDCV